ncbi:hypothetical protein M011DRAFT_380460, partial [Sporormia fimetaria CBS 119925]
LTLEKLASYDDVITDALVDKVYFWATIRKNRGGRFSASRGLQQDEITEIIRKTIVFAKDPPHAVKQLLQLPGLRKYHASLKDEKEKEHFTRHLSRYAKIYMPDCPFEVTTTNRYTIDEHEASITARKEINPREEIKYLTGVQVAMTEEQEKLLELARKDFSLVISSRKKTRSLFLGPARFANHDCNANARLCTKGYDGMQVVAVKPIEVGEEITVSYGDDYFGEDNQECLCKTCEDRLVNGWAPYKKVDTDEEQEEEEVHEEEVLTSSASHTSGKKRTREEAHDLDSVDRSPAAKRVRLEKEYAKSEAPNGLSASPPRRRSPKSLRETTLKRACSASSPQQNALSSIESSLSSDSTGHLLSQQRVGFLEVTLVDASSSRDSTPHSATNAASPGSDPSTDATSVDGDTLVTETKLQPSIDVKPTYGVATLRSSTQQSAPLSLIALHELPEAPSASSSELSELASDYELDDKHQQVIKRKGPKILKTTRTTRSHTRYVEPTRTGTPIPSTSTIPDGMHENTRKPGDYINSPAVLSAKYSKWVECHTCDEYFVQQDGYQTRRDCPRCERHSMLYGYPWPKTDKEGKHDKEERILDPRQIYRFVDPGEEKNVRREKKVLRERLRERFETPRSESVGSPEVESGRRRRRGR